MPIIITGLKDLKQDIQSFKGELQNYDSMEAKTEACKIHLPELENRTRSLYIKIRDLKETVQNQIDSHSQELTEALSTEEPQFHKGAIKVMLYKLNLKSLELQQQEVKAASNTLQSLRLLLLRGGLIKRESNGN